MHLVIKFTKVIRVTIGVILLASALIFSGIQWPIFAHAQNATMSDRSLLLSSSTPSDVATYTVSFTAPAQPTVGSIKVEFCANSPLFTEPCDPPATFDIAAANLTAQSGDTGFSIDPSTTANVLILSRAPSATSGGPAAYELANVTNTSTKGTQYARFKTYASTDGTGPTIDYGAIAYAINDTTSVTIEVPPYMVFCLGTIINSVDCSDIVGNYLSLGDFSAAKAATGQIQMVLATNANNGYIISINGSTMASGSNIIPPLNTPTVSAPGNSQFGINLRANTNPLGGQNPSGPGSGMPTADYNIVNKFTFRSGDIVASKASAEDYRKYTMTYLVNISSHQEPGIYAGTYNYVALGNF